VLIRVFLIVPLKQANVLLNIITSQECRNMRYLYKYEIHE